jgi:hypothetical protein
MQSYFKNEYRNDHEWAFNNWLESKAEAKKKSFFQYCCDLWSLAFPTEQQLKEKYLNQATDLVDLEHRLENWDRRSSRQNNSGVMY